MSIISRSYMIRVSDRQTSILEMVRDCMNEGLIPHSSSYPLTATHSVSYPLTATHSVSYPLTATHSVSYPLTATHSVSHDCKHLNHVFNSELRLSQSIMHSLLSTPRTSTSSTNFVHPHLTTTSLLLRLADCGNRT
jgi:hypothetical protein